MERERAGEIEREMNRKYLHHTSDRDGEVREMHLAATDETTDGTAGRPLFEIRAREARGHLWSRRATIYGEEERVDDED